MRGNSKEHLLFFLDKIKKNEYFGIIRPGDGEHAILMNTSINTSDKWTFTQNSRLHTDIGMSMSKNIPSLYIGIPCECCNKQMKDDYIRVLNLPAERTTYANIFCNANWQDFIHFLKDYTKGFSLVTGGKQETSEFVINDRLIIDEHLVNKWDTSYENETSRIMNWLSTKNDEMICFSAGPLSKVWIPIAMEKYPNNIYLDIGSSIDIYTKGSTNRPYTIDGHYYNRLICNFNV